MPEVEEKETQAVQRNLTPWERVQLSRDKARPVGAEYIEELFTDFMEFHGDRYYQDDKAIIGGIARFSRNAGDGDRAGKGSHDKRKYRA